MNVRHGLKILGCPSCRKVCEQNYMICKSGQIIFYHFKVAMIDTQNDSIQSLNFGKKGFNSIFNSILVSQNSIQTIIQFKKNCGDSIQ